MASKKKMVRWQRLAIGTQVYALIFVIGLCTERTDWKATLAALLIATSMGLCLAGWLDLDGDDVRK